MFLTAEFMYKSHGILGFFLRQHSPRRYFQKTETGKYSFQVTVNAKKKVSHSLVSNQKIIALVEKWYSTW